MSYSKKRFRHDSLQNKRSVGKILNAITQGIADGTLIFSDEENSIEMEPNDLLDLKVTANQEGDHQKVNIRISWQTKSKKKSNKKQLVIKKS